MPGLDPVAFAAELGRRAVRRAHALPAAAGDGQGARAVRHRRPADRAAVAAGVPRRRRRAGRDAARLRRTPLLGAAPTPTGRAWRSSSTTGRSASPTARRSCLRSATFYPEPERGGVRRARGSTRARRSSRCTCRWVASTSATRCSTEVWGVLEDAGTPSSSMPAPAPSGRRTPDPGPVADLLRAAPAARAGDRPPRRAGVRRVPRPRRDLRAGPRSTRRWCSRRSSTGSAPRSRPTWCPGYATSQPKVLLGSDFPNIPYPYAEQLDGARRPRPRRRLARAVCWEQRRPPLRGLSGIGDLGVDPVEWMSAQLNRGLIGFDLGRQFQGKRVEKPTSSRKRSSETYKCQR